MCSSPKSSTVGLKLRGVAGIRSETLRCLFYREVLRCCTSIRSLLISLLVSCKLYLRSSILFSSSLIAVLPRSSAQTTLFTPSQSKARYPQRDSYSVRTRKRRSHKHLPWCRSPQGVLPHSHQSPHLSMRRSRSQQTECSSSAAHTQVFAVVNPPILAHGFAYAPSIVPFPELDGMAFGE